jgi:small-conductance mechanosensitive channel
MVQWHNGLTALSFACTRNNIGLEIVFYFGIVLILSFFAFVPLRPLTTEAHPELVEGWRRWFALLRRYIPNALFRSLICESHK